MYVNAPTWSGSDQRGETITWRCTVDVYITYDILVRAVGIIAYTYYVVLTYCHLCTCTYDIVTGKKKKKKKFNEKNEKISRSL